MPKDRDPDSGQFTKAVGDDALVAHIEEQGGASTSEAATHFDYDRPTAYRRLTKLREQDVVDSREVGNSLLWLVPVTSKPLTSTVVQLAESIAPA